MKFAFVNFTKIQFGAIFSYTSYGLHGRKDKQRKPILELPSLVGNQPQEQQLNCPV